jgi:hypothetical protein
MERRQRSRRTLATALAAGSVIALITGHPTTATAAEDAAGTAMVAERPANPESAQVPSELAREGLAKLLQAVNKLIEAVPQFEMPEMNENGDIILRRKRPEGGHPAAPAEATEQPENRAI